MTTAIQRLKELQAQRRKDDVEKRHKKAREAASEKLVAKHLVQAVKDAGGAIFKMHPLTNKGIPDYLVFYHGRTFFVETKTTGKTCEPAQIEFHKMLKEQGVETWVLDRKILNIHDLRLYAYKTYKKPTDNEYGQNKDWRKGL